MRTPQNGGDGPQATLASQSGQFAVRHMLAEMTQRLAEWGMPAERISTIELVAAEALNNVIEHACGFADGVPFVLTMRREADRLLLDIVDHGRPMPGLSLPLTALSGAELPQIDVPSRDLPEGGWGWLLIRDLTEKVSYCREGDANRLSMELLWAG